MRYLCSIAVLAIVPIVFFFLVRGKLHSFGKAQWVLRIVLSIPLFVSSAGHFLRTATFASIVPPVFPDPAAWVVFTGILELAGAIGLLVPKTSKAAAVCLVLLMIAVFPANIYAAHRVVGGLHMPGVPLRLAMQIVYVLLLLIAGWGVPSKSR